MSKFNEPFDIAAEQRDRLAIATFRQKGHYPVIMFSECYIYFGEWVQIVSVEQEYMDKYLEVVVESRSAERKCVSFDELDWHFGRRMSEFMQEQGFVDVWSQYEF